MASGCYNDLKAALQHINQVLTTLAADDTASATATDHIPDSDDTNVPDTCQLIKSRCWESAQRTQNNI